MMGQAHQVGLKIGPIEFFQRLGDPSVQPYAPGVSQLVIQGFPYEGMAELIPIAGSFLPHRK